MSRKHYRDVAEIIKTEVDRTNPAGGVRPVLARVAGELASMFKRDNGNFNRDKFMEACGL
jgi:hypothetical protein